MMFFLVFGLQITARCGNCIYNWAEWKTAMEEYGGMPCGYKLGGRNMTNLERHLKAPPCSECHSKLAPQLKW